jgi:hypothetical protein
MTPYEANYRKLNDLLQGRDHVRIQNDAHVPLVVEKIKGEPHFRVCQVREQNGALVAGPEIVFLFSEETLGQGEGSRTLLEAMPVRYRNDFTGQDEVTSTGHLGDPLVRLKWQFVLDRLVQDWWRSVAKQGYFEKARELAAKRTAEQENDAVATPDADPGPEMEP